MPRTKTAKKNTKRKTKKASPNIVGSIHMNEHKKAKPVKSEKEKLKALAELKKVQSKIDKMNRVESKRFQSQSKLFDKARTLREKLDID